MLSANHLRAGQNALNNLRIRDCRETDEKGNTLMTLKYLKQVCREQKLYSTPELNDNIYLHFKGFSEIGESLGQYTGLKSLWLEGNGISKIEHLSSLKELKCLYMQQNTLTDISNLEELPQLHTLNVSNNLLRNLDLNCFKNQQELCTLQMSHNYFKTAASVHAIASCTSLSVLDLSHNEINDVEIVSLLERLPNLAVLDLRGNPVIRNIDNYRRTLISKIKSLTHLDERPVFDKERRCVEAWVRGGPDAEREERQIIHQEEKNEHERHFQAMMRMQEEARARRLAAYGPEGEPEFTPRLAQLRDEMLQKPSPVSR